MKLETIENLEQQDAIAATSLDYIDEMFDEETFKEVRNNLREIKDISSSTIILDKVKEILGNKNEKKSKKKI